MTCPGQFFRHWTNARLDRALTGWHLAWIWTQRDFLMKGNNAISWTCESQVLRPCSCVFPCPKVSVAAAPKTSKYTLSPVTSSPFDSGKEGGKGEMQLWVAHRFGKVHADSEFGKEKNKVGPSTSEGVCLLPVLWKNWQAQALWLQEP